MANSAELFGGQSKQDMFAWFMTGEKRDGTFLEIGANHPTQFNNTYVLERDYGWRGLMVEYLPEFTALYDQWRPLSHYVIGDARNVDYAGLFRQYDFPKDMDYLQIDLDVDNRSTLDTLQLLDRTLFDTYRFATVTFEHDIYRGNFFDTRQISRELFQRRGYVLMYPDVQVHYGGQDCAYEDWYVHPDLVDPLKIALYRSYESRLSDAIAAEWVV